MYNISSPGRVIYAISFDNILPHNVNIPQLVIMPKTNTIAKKTLRNIQ